MMASISFVVLGHRITVDMSADDGGNIKASVLQQAIDIIGEYQHRCCRGPLSIFLCGPASL